MSETELFFEGITTGVFESVKQKLTDKGLCVPDGTEGVISGQGVTARVAWDAAAEKLSVSILEKPFFLPMETITGEVIRIIGECGGRMSEQA